MTCMPEVVRLQSAHGQTVSVICLLETIIESMKKKNRPENKGPNLPSNRSGSMCNLQSYTFLRVFSPSPLCICMFPTQIIKTFARECCRTFVAIFRVSVTSAFCFMMRLQFCWNIGCRMLPIFRALESHILKIMTHSKHWKNACCESLFAAAAAVSVKELPPNAPGCFKLCKCSIHRSGYYPPTIKDHSGIFDRTL